MVWTQKDYENINDINRVKAIEAMQKLNYQIQSMSNEDKRHSLDDYWPPGDDYYWKREEWEEGVSFFDFQTSQALSNTADEDKKHNHVNRKKDKKRNKDNKGDIGKKDLSYYYHVKL